MSSVNENLGLCPVCRKGHLYAEEQVRVFEPHGKRVEVKLQTSRCDVCRETTTKSFQHKENLHALAARKSEYGNVLMGEEILALRKRYGLTQQQASAIFGKGKIAFSRYESETTYPDESTTLLLTLAMKKPDVVKWLAEQAGVEIPLWAERCEDDQRVKLSFIRSVPSNTVQRSGMLRSAVASPRLSSSHVRMIGGATQQVVLVSNAPACNEAEMGLEACGS